MAITCRNSIFWALVASSFLGESIQSESAGTTTCPVPHGRGLPATLDRGSHHTKNLQGITGINQRNLADHHDSKELYGEWEKRAQTDSGLCHVHISSHVIRQLAAQECGFHSDLHFTNKATAPER